MIQALVAAGEARLAALHPKPRPARTLFLASYVLARLAMRAAIHTVVVPLAGVARLRRVPHRVVGWGGVQRVQMRFRLAAYAQWWASRPQWRLLDNPRYVAAAWAALAAHITTYGRDTYARRRVAELIAAEDRLRRAGRLT